MSLPKVHDELLLVLDGSLGDPVAAVVPADGEGGPRLAPAEIRAAGVMPQISALLPGLERRRISGVVLGVGPGSYSGIRTAAGAAASIAIALSVPLAPLRSDVSLARAAGGTVYLALGARELLCIDEHGATLLSRDESDAHPLDAAARAALSESLVAELARAGRTALRGTTVDSTTEAGSVIDPARTPIALRYLAHPRGAVGKQIGGA